MASHVGKKVIVVQNGARRQYAIPAALAKAGCLEALYTDICAGKGAIQILEQAASRLPSKRLQSLFRRRPPQQVLERTVLFPKWAWDVRVALKSPSDADRLRKLRRAHSEASKCMSKQGFGNATHLYSMFGECIDYQLAARRAGLITITDVNIAPSAEKIVSQVQAQYPDWEAPKNYFGQESATAVGIRPIMDMLKESTDIFLCPSEFVQSDLVSNFGVLRSRTRLVPYAVNPKWLTIKAEPSLGRVLFVGKAELRKGIHTLCKAANILNERDVDCEIRVVGDAPNEVRKHPEARNISFLGRMGPDRLKDEYTKADIFVLPSLAEGSAGVTYEALGAGVPIVTTYEAGSCVTHGKEGMIVKREDPALLANAIESLVLNRDLRNDLAQNARKRAEELNWEHYTARLVDALFASIVDQ